MEELVLVVCHMLLTFVTAYIVARIFQKYSVPIILKLAIHGGIILLSTLTLLYLNELFVLAYWNISQKTGLINFAIYNAVCSFYYLYGYIGTLAIVLNIQDCLKRRKK